MTSTFNLLTAGGARFDKKRFATDFELFESGSKRKAKGKERARPTDIPTSLDYFHSAHHGTQRASASDDEDEDSEAESSTSSSTVQPPKHKITLTGPEPLPKSLHSNLPSLVTHPSHPLSSSAGNPLLAALKHANIRLLWGVQCAVSGSLLSGHDTMCIAPTGSGKTLSYLLPTLIALGDPARALQGRDEGVSGIRALIVVPTHDLAIQIKAVAKAITAGRAWRVIVLSKATEKAVIESAPGATRDGAEEANTKIVEKTDALAIDILIATPERLHHLVDQRSIDLSQTRHLVLDEADRLFSDDFRSQIEPILAAASHASCLKAFLSATIPSGSEALAKKWMKGDYVRVVVGVKDSAVSTVEQSLLYTASEPGKLMALKQLLSSGSLPYPSLIFVQSVQRAEDLYRSLVLENVDASSAMDGVRVGLVHGDKSAKARDDAIQGFREGKVWVLVVTEVLARGMDFRGVKVVVNYGVLDDIFFASHVLPFADLTPLDFPQTTQSYIHRIGRTGRAGQPGKAITFFTDVDAPHLRTIANVLRASGCQVPEWMLELKKPGKNEKHKVARAPVKRARVGEGGRDVGRELVKRKRDMIEAGKRRKTKRS
ncbi:P-loop containing nucleoside triphosphate hydrolase protein [Kockovaella imperatae]|uniref:RNA helicase n=1 Tax=Kockovaella imperatae TaxID=4999 RepID=A0A1Y1UDZ5_9TREE|nr:P-loop containing nucleoside triphosphate hydrolase protein [Kockovaella imperatae]ORX36219.1 P-loop containing nucleoside triphosphate hydrolase protein [Kockovaella imperatae]